MCLAELVAHSEVAFEADDDDADAVACSELAPRACVVLIFFSFSELFK